MKNNKLAWVNQLRGIAILGVLFVHIIFWFPSLSFLQKSYYTNFLIMNGARGVQLFFLASAFTLFLSYENRHRKEKYTTLNFFIRRYFRIAPLYYIGIILYGFLLISMRNGPVSISNLLLSLTFLNGFSPKYINDLVPGGWSIAVEMLFYCLLPILVVFIKDANRALNFLNFSLISNVCVSIIIKHTHLILDISLRDNFLFFYLPNQLPIFALGILLYFVIKSTSFINELSLYSIGFFAITFFANIYLGGMFMTQHIQFGFFFFLLALFLSRIDVGSKRFIGLKILEYIGELSFSIYLMHFAVLELIKYLSTKMNLSPQPSSIISAGLFYLLIFIILLIISLAISAVTFEVIEKRGQRIGNWLIAKWE